MSNKYALGLTGLAGHGKSTVANYLVEQHGFVRFSLAGPLKAMARRINPIIGADGIRLNDAFDTLGGDEAQVKALYPEYRRFLQGLGTDGIRTIDDEFWTRALDKSIWESVHTHFVIDDVRFPNEARAFNNLWNIHRPNHDGGGGNHISEQHAGKMGERDFLVNYGTVEELHRTIEIHLPFLKEL